MGNRFEGLPRRKVAGVFFRCLSKRHKADPLNVSGSLDKGARYNPPGEFAALYLSDSLDTSRNEVKRRNPLARDEDYPVFPVRIEIDDILDLTNSKIRGKLLLRHDDNDLIRTNHLNTQALAKAARVAGFKGILAPSATGKGTNLVIFIDKTDQDDTIELDHS